MREPLMHKESPTEYFRELVESALQHQHVAVRELTSFYVVNLLAGFAHRDPSGRRQEILSVAGSAFQ